METFWFIAVTGMLAVYVVLDGFDFGAGMLGPVVARTDAQRRTLLSAIGPVWSGNEVWLIAAGGLLFFAFPRAYASGFSGFYLALILVLWLFMARGLSIELRSHFGHPLWTSLWDFTLALSSALLAVVFGAALGNLLRGVPLSEEGYFFVPFWTDLTPGPAPGILDWFTVLMAVTTTVMLAWHGANYLAMKATGPLAERSSRVSLWSGWVVVGLTFVSLFVIPIVRPAITENYGVHPFGYACPMAAVVGLVVALAARRTGRDVIAFLGSSVTILGLLASSAWGLYPNLLVSTTNPAHSLTIFNAATSPYGMAVGVKWFMVGFTLVLLYSVMVHRLFWGKVDEATSVTHH